MAAGPDAIAERTVEALQRELADARAERDAAQAREAALAEVLRAINASHGEPGPVCDLITERAMTMCDADGADLLAIKDGFATSLSMRNPTPVQVEFWKKPFDLSQGADRLQHDPQTIHHVDMTETEVYKARRPLAVMAVEGAGMRTLVQVPLTGEGGLVGQFALYRRSVRPFTDKQIALVEAFAAQAALVIENARLLTEQREALEQQTATADILRVISQSPTDIQPVLEAVAHAAQRFCGAADVSIALRDGDEMYYATHVGPFPATVERTALDPSRASGRSILEGRTIHLHDIQSLDPVAFAGARRLSAEVGFQSSIAAPMMREGTAIGCVLLRKPDPAPFTPRQIELLETFAAQAVIAIENVRLFTEQRELLEQQTATAEILQVISQSPTDVAPVLQAVARAAVRFCGAEDVAIALRDGDSWYAAAHVGPISAVTGNRFPLARETLVGRAMIDGQTMHIAEVNDLDPAEFAGARDLAARLGFRAALIAPMMREGAAIGAITLRRLTPGAFTPRQVALLEAFAAQAVIAIENVRLFTELRDSLEQQTATAEVLRVISQSPTEVQPVLEAVTAAAQRFCGAADVSIALRDGAEIYYATHVGPLPATFGRTAIDPGRASGRAILEGRTIHLHDIQSLDPVEFAGARRFSAEVGFQSSIAAPMMREGTAIGCVLLRKPEPAPFTPRQIELLETFAAQAVIAIENARLFTELRDSLEQQTATGDILRVISQSPTDVGPVLTTVVKAALRFCGAEDAFVALRDGDQWVNAAHEGIVGGNAGDRFPLTRQTTAGQALLDGRTAHFADIAALDPVQFATAHRNSLQQGFRASLAAPLLREGIAIGAVVLRRTKPGAFAPRQIELLEGFAAQAVIAIENVRLFTELRESLEQQTATAEILQVINSSPGEVQPVFEAILERAMQACQADFGLFNKFDGRRFNTVATRGVPAAFAEYRRATPFDYSPGTTPARLIAGEPFVHVADVKADELYRAGDPNRRAIADLGGARSVLNVALRKDDAILGSIIVYRKEVRAFSDKQIALLQGFGAQALIAMENARLFTELRQRTDDLTESLEYQTATSELLDVISRSATDVQPVLDTMLASAGRLCNVQAGGVAVRRGDAMHYVATLGQTPQFDKWLRETPHAIARSSGTGRAALEKDVVHIADIRADPEYAMSQTVAVGKVRTLLSVPLLRDSEVAGVISLTRTQVEPFTERQIALVRNFADQAVIAMENARLLSELTRREEELRVTFDHMGDGVVMFDADLRLASWNRNFQELLDIPDSFLAGQPNLEDYVRLLVGRGEVGQGDEAQEVTRYRERANQQWSTERTRPDGRIVEVRNNPVPGGGAVLIYSDITERKKAEAEIAAARDAAEAALERQTATADILKVIASSPTDVQPVLEAVAKAAVRFCGAADALINLRDGDSWVATAHEGTVGHIQGTRSPLNRETATGRAIIDGLTCHLPNIAALDPVEFARTRRTAVEHGFAAVVAAPLLRDGVAVGCVALRKVEPEPFTPPQIAMLETFAAQAVIAIENVRLFTELRETLEQQTATAEILTVISQSPTDVGPVLSAVARAAMKFCSASDAQVALREGGHWMIAAHEGPIDALPGQRTLTRHTAPGRAMIDGKVVQIVDLQTVDAAEFPETRELGARLGFRSVLAAPLLRDDVTIGAISLRRSEAGEFEPRQVELLKTFAAQAVIAIENVRLFTELRESLERLKAAQANLVQSEKMATLGQLTAGIAHEIKNPLNFVNNFASLSVELLDELREVAGPALKALDGGRRAEVDETMSLLISNLGKITEHGKRADGIVKSMLSHSRGGSGEWQASDINALVEEALNLAYHGARAQDKEFNVTLERDFAKDGQPIEVVPQDVTRVFLNLFGNGFYATNKRHLGKKEPGFKPTLKVSTRETGDGVEVRVRDNGIGMPPEVKEKLFQPFFTTKPTGEGTGLGLSISYDIVTQQHGGTIEVESEAGKFTEFTIRLPRSRRVVSAERA